MINDAMVQFLDDARIPYVVTGNEHCRPGWVQVSCPFCPGGDHDFHLGINLAGQYASCYRCGFHSIESLLRETVGVYREEAVVIKKQIFKGAPKAEQRVYESTCKDFKLPGTVKAHEHPLALNMLSKRFPGYNLEKLVKTYDLKATPYDFMWKKSDGESTCKYANKLVIPNRYNGDFVSFQCRGFLDGDSGYITAHPSEELIHHKTFLWGSDYVPLDAVIVVEGFMNVATIGHGAVHTHGAQIIPALYAELATYRRVYLAMDMDKTGRSACEKIAANLSHKTKVFILRYGAKDPNDLLKTTQGKDEVRQMRELVQ